VVTGDDFGFSRGVNRAILEAHDRGVLTSASLMVTGPAWEEAVALARDRPRLAVGLHLVLASGNSVLPPDQIPRLVDSSGRFRKSPARAGLVYQFRPGARAELRREIRAQLERFRRTGLRLAHVDGHLHLHVHPLVLDALADLSGEFGIETVRLPREELGLALELDGGAVAAKLLWSSIFGYLGRRGAARLRAAGVGVADRVYGLHRTGRVNERYLLDLLPRISAGWTEIYCHPALPFDGEPHNGPPGAGPRELAALVSPRVRAAIEAAGLALASSPEAAAGASGRIGAR
jgi:hopanoid biosynthesis associated protein HpnK